MKSIILSPPFSNIYRNSLCSNIIGTYTSERRRGLHRVFTTLKPVKGGWINNVGLRNPGIENLYRKYKEDDIVSIYFEDYKEWRKIFSVLKNLNIEKIELNISCPNYKSSGINKNILTEAIDNFKFVSLKMPHGIEYAYVAKFFNRGARIFHISNSLKTPYGGLSGKNLVYNNVCLIKRMKKELKGHIKVIGGGGIYDIDTAQLYIDSGVDYVSLSTALLNPLKLKRLIDGINEKF